jgi:hypothetical protein
VHFGHRNARDFGPCLVCIRVVVQELVTEHESNCEKSIFTAGLSLDAWVELLQAVDEQESEDDDILCHLGG